MVQCTGVAIYLEGLNFTFSKISNGKRTQMYGENPLLGRLGALYSFGGILRSAESPAVIVFRESWQCQEKVWIWNDLDSSAIPR